MNELLKGTVTLANMPEPFKEFLRNGGKGRVDCSLHHPGFTCEQWFSFKFPKVFRNSLNIYLMVHVIPTLVFRFKQIKQDPMRQVKRMIKNILCSAMFLTM